jgi:purine-nucleoside phosphorylase
VHLEDFGKRFPSEVRAFQKLGADVVGMSVVYEVIVASQMNINVLGIAYVLNMSTKFNGKALTHEEVLKNGKKVSDKISKIIKKVI